MVALWGIEVGIFGIIGVGVGLLTLENIGGIDVSRIGFAQVDAGNPAYCTDDAFRLSGF